MPNGADSSPLFLLKAWCQPCLYTKSMAHAAENKHLSASSALEQKPGEHSCLKYKVNIQCQQCTQAKAWYMQLPAAKR